MTYKQVIDGVDVSGCEFDNKDDKTCREVNGKYDTDICEFDKCKNSNCYYKQLARKEQECEGLKEMLKDLSYENQKFGYKIEEQTKQSEPFKDEYFKGLETIAIAELAKNR